MGGAEKVVCELADKLYEKNVDVKIVYFVEGVIVRPENPIPLIYISIKKNFFSIFKLINLIKLEDPDVIHSHMFHANMFARLLKFFYKKIKVICTSHSSFEGGRIKMLIYALTENLCDLHTNVSKKACEALTEAGAVRRNKIIPIYNGINLDKYKPIDGAREKINNELNLPDDSKIILSVGRLNTPKDYPTLLKSFELVLSKNNNTYLLVAGDGDKKNELINICEEKKILHHVKFLGIRKDIPLLLSACDLFVSSSAWEGFGLAILEAMISQKPIVSTNTDGAVELLPSDNLVEKGDFVQLSSKIIDLLDCSDNKFKYDNVEFFDWEYIIDKWLKIYKNEDFSC